MIATRKKTREPQAEFRVNAKNKTSKLKGGTSSDKLHRYESFSKRVSKISVNPVRRTVPTTLDHAALSTESSLFGQALQEWAEINISQSFVDFLHATRNTCETLPQIIHHADSIMNNLEARIKEKNELSLEPLLNLLTYLARDLGPRFESYFGRTVILICDTASVHNDINVVEWCFNSLAWLFKYLSKLLIPDLRPLYELMAPILGKVRQKQFVMRFATEAFSFLIRKASFAYEKNPEPLNLIMTHILADVTTASEPAKGRFAESVINLMFESLRGVKRMLHVTGPKTFVVFLKQLVISISDSHQASRSCFLVSELLNKIAYHVDDVEPIVEHMLQVVSKLSTGNSALELELAALLLKTITVMRKGSMIRDWAKVFRVLENIVRSKMMQGINIEIMEHLQDAIVAVFCYSSIEQARNNVALLHIFVSGSQRAHFLRMCWKFSHIDGKRFEQLSSPLLQGFTENSSFEYAAETGCLLSHLFTSGYKVKGTLTCPVNWQSELCHSFEVLANGNEEDDHLITLKCFVYVQMLNTMNYSQTTCQSITRSLKRLIFSASSHIGTKEISIRTLFAFTGALEFLSQSGHCYGSLWSLVCASSEKLKFIPLFWKAVIAFLENQELILSYEDEAFEIIIDSLIQPLSNASHELRSICLRTIRVLYQKASREPPKLLGCLSVVEDTSPTLENVRSLSAEMRKMGSLYRDAAIDPWLYRAVPSFCFGLLHVKLSQLWDDARLVMLNVIDEKKSDDFLVDRLVSWLQARGLVVQTDDGANKFDEKFGLDEQNSYLQNFFDYHVNEQPEVTASCRSQALRLMDGIPHFVESKSRHIVPIFLEAQNRLVMTSFHSEAEEATCGSARCGFQSQRWNRRDCKSFLRIFSKFKNPRVIFGSQEVYKSLIKLLGNGDLEYQQLALKTIQTWGLSAVRRYFNQLNSLLDETKYNDELLSFLGNELREGVLKDNERTELTPILMHILYGRATAKGTSTAGFGGPCARRRNIIVSISNLGHEELEMFFDIALHQSKVEVPRNTSDKTVDGLINHNLRNLRGLLKMIEDMLVALGSNLAIIAPKMLTAVLSCIKYAAECFKEHELRNEARDVKDNSLHKLVRRDAINCVILYNERFPGLVADTDLSVIVTMLVQPRLELLPDENVHSISSILRLLGSLLANSEQASYLLKECPSVLTKLLECLNIPTAKPEVIQYILGACFIPLFELISNDRLQQTSNGAPRSIQSPLLDCLSRETNHIVANLSYFLKKCMDRDLIQLGFKTLSLVARLVCDTEGVVEIIATSTYLLHRGPKKINVSTVEDILRLVRYLFAERELRLKDIDHSRLLRAFCEQFKVQRKDNARALLCSALDAFPDESICQKEESQLRLAINLSIQLNAALPQRLGLTNEDQQMSAFSNIVQLTSSDFATLFWELPFSNVLYYLRYSDDFVVRSHCTAALQRLIDIVDEESEVGNTVRGYIKEALIPYFYRGMLDKSEIKRAELLALCAYLIEKCPEIHVLSELQVLNFRNEMEASFFSNILHVQTHRRVRALRRLSKEVSRGKISSRNIKSFLLPLIQHFILKPKEGDSNQTLALEAIIATGSLLNWLKWDEYLNLLDVYFGYLKSGAYNINLTVKLIGVAADSTWKASTTKSCITSYKAGISEGDTRETDDYESLPTTRLALTLPETEGLIQDLTAKRLPTLMKYLREKEANEIRSRASIAISAIKLIMTLPEQEIMSLLPSVLSDLARMLKSREQDSRDLARKALAEAVGVLGPTYFSSILKELQSALSKGYQLHILGFTLHSLLLTAVDCFNIGTLDYCISQIMQSICDDIFGQTGKDKDSEGYTNKIKEVKVQKSFDSVELMTRLIRPHTFMEILAPIQKLLCGKVDTSSLIKLEEVLRRLCLGIAYNGTYHDQSTLVLCYELFVNSPPIPSPMRQSNHFTFKDDVPPKSRNYPLHERTTIYIQKMRRFALDAAKVVIQRTPELRTPSSISGLLPIINEAILDEHEEVKISGLRLLVTVVKVPSPKLDSDAATHVSEAVRIIEETPATNTEIAQASIKLVAAILKERKSVRIRDRDIIYILEKMKPDLREPDRQGVTFNFLKAVLSRIFLAPEVYDVVDEVAKVMVTSQSTNAREQARALYLQFLIEYPQSQKRLTTQIAFLLKNLEYEHTDGRVSVMEALHIILKKTGNKVLQPLIEKCFLPILLVICNDKASECREMAGELMKLIFRKADNRLVGNFLLLLNEWLEKTEQLDLQCMSLRCWNFFWEADRTLTVIQLEKLCSTLLGLLSNSPSNSVSEPEWEVRYLNLELLMKILGSEAGKSTLLSYENFWRAIISELNFPHAWVKLSAARLVGVLLSSTKSCDAHGNQSRQLKLSQRRSQLSLNDVIYITLRSFDVLDSLVLSEQLAIQTARNLVYLGCQLAMDSIEFADKSLIADGSAMLPHIRDSAEALAHLFMKIASLIPRHPTMIRSEKWHSQIAVLQLLSDLIQKLNPNAIEPSMRVILAPLYLLVVSDSKAPIDCDPTSREAYKAIIERSNNIMDRLRDGCSLEFLEALQEVRRETFEKRNVRRSKRKLQAINMPERELAKKRKKHESTRRRRKEKSLQARGKRRGW